MINLNATKSPEPDDGLEKAVIKISREPGDGVEG
jgi:hypothetical protein